MTNQPQNITALNGNSLKSPQACANCMKRSLCPVSATGDVDAAAPGVSVRTFRTGEIVLQAGDTFDGVYMVRSGFFKSSFIDASGEMQVTGFHFPGESFGIDSISSGTYGNTVSALDTGSVCRIPFSMFDAGKSRSDARAPERTLTLVRMMSSALSRDRNMIFNLGKMDARRRFAVFLLDIAARMKSSGYSDTEFQLCMSRTDISNYLCLAIETVSRLFSQFHAQQYIDVDRRQLRLLDVPALEALARNNQVVEQAPMKKAG